MKESKFGVTHFKMYDKGGKSLIGWKAAQDRTLIKLRIPARAKRLICTSDPHTPFYFDFRQRLASRKCRAEYAIVEQIYHKDVSGRWRPTPKYFIAYSTYFEPRHGYMTYRAGEKVRPRKPFDETLEQQCTSGIHFFLDRKDAIDYMV